jgi:hypothetical protein
MAPYRLAVVFLRDCLDAPRAILTSRVSQRGQLGREPHGEAVGGRGSAVVQVSHARLVSSLGAGVAVAAPPIRGGPLDVGARGGHRSVGGPAALKVGPSPEGLDARYPIDAPICLADAVVAHARIKDSPRFYVGRAAAMITVAGCA